MSVRFYPKEISTTHTLSAEISSLKTPDQFNRLLNQTVTISISWQGKRMMSVAGVPGEIEIETLIRQFLGKAPIVDYVSRSLKERLDWYDLWTDIQRIYQRSNEALQKTWAYKYYVPAKGEDSVDVLNCNSVKNSLLGFSRERFTEIWPDQAAKYDDAVWDRTREVYVTRGMLAEAYRSQTSTLF